MSSISVPDVTGAEKFIGESSISTLIVETDIGYSLASKCLKTVPYETHELFLSNGMSLRAADRHIVIDSTGAERYIKDLTPNDSIATKYGPKRVARVVKREHSVNMYDLSLDDDRHLYYTNGILSHNSTIIAMYLLWFGMFNFDKTILVASNKNTNAMEIMARIKYAYEELPMWLKPGVNYYTKHSMEFDNGSKIISQATTANTGRGMSLSLLMLDELAFVPKRIQEEMWTSLAPTLSTGGSCIVSSTPNGDDELFAELWRSAEFGTSESAVDGNGFKAVKVEWDEHPDRDDSYRIKMSRKIGELKWRQEYECVSGDSMVCVEIDGIDRHMTIEDLYELLRN